MVADRIAEPFGMTPTTVTGVLPSFTVEPTTSVRPSNERCHTSYPSTTTPGAPGISSASRSPRPIRGVTRAVRNAVAVSAAVRISTGGVLPTIRFRSSVRYAPRPSIDRTSLRHSRKSRATRSSGWFVRALCVSMMTRRSPSGSGIVGHSSFRQVVPARADPDRNGEREPARQRQPRIFPEHPAAELVILQHCVLVVTAESSTAVPNPAIQTPDSTAILRRKFPGSSWSRS